MWLVPMRAGEQVELPLLAIMVNPLVFYSPLCCCAHLMHILLHFVHHHFFLNIYPGTLVLLYFNRGCRCTLATQSRRLINVWVQVCAWIVQLQSRSFSILSCLYEIDSYFWCQTFCGCNQSEYNWNQVNSPEIWQRRCAVPSIWFDFATLTMLYFSLSLSRSPIHSQGFPSTQM